MEQKACLNSAVKRIFVEKKTGFDIAAADLYADLNVNLGIETLMSVRIINRYDIEGITEQEYIMARSVVFSEPPVDDIYDEQFSIDPGDRFFAIEYLPGQYDQRADSAAQCIQILTRRERPTVRTAKLIVLKGEVSDYDYRKIKDYCINPVEAREASLDKPSTLNVETDIPADVACLSGFIHMRTEELNLLIQDMGLAMGLDDIQFCQKYFLEEEARDPTITEIRAIDTYWSDHCRHTTFLTRLDKIEIEKAESSKPILAAYFQYLGSRQSIYGNPSKDISFMDLATIGMKDLEKRGLLEDLDQSDENNACSIIVPVDVDGHTEDYLIMFKNETHNHPTEIEPFGGAATCLGGAIRDPLSGRAYVYQAMRVTGSGDPRTRVEDTVLGKLPQKKITVGAAAGFSAYGNQIGLATGLVAELYDEGYVAKRMEIGAVIAAVPKRNVFRSKPSSGDVIILLGGRTGRDGCGGATGSSKAHTQDSLTKCGAEVQKGNPVEERKIQRLFRNAAVTGMIKKCNDFGAGGVSVAIGELADGVNIDLDAVLKKYEGLDGTELAISESQERMAVVVSAENVKPFIEEAAKENLEAAAVAVVTAESRLKMVWRDKTIVDISRKFLDTNGVTKQSDVYVKAPDLGRSFFCSLPGDVEKLLPDLDKAWLCNLGRLEVCSQRGLAERFDSTIGANTVLLPFGGKNQLTPAECMVAKIPVVEGDTTTGTIMSYGYNPAIGNWSPFHAGIYAVVEAVAKVVAAGGDFRKIRLSLQEYFEKLGNDPKKWGNTFGALLGAYHAQMRFSIPAIGGKDSMSGSFNDLNVPPTIVAFAVASADVNRIISPEFKRVNSIVVVLWAARDENQMPDFEQMILNYRRVYEIIGQGKALAAHTIKAGGMCEAVAKMCFGNLIGFEFDHEFDPVELFTPAYGSLVLEVPEGESVELLFDGLKHTLIGRTCQQPVIMVNKVNIDLITALQAWQQPLEQVFPTKASELPGIPAVYSFKGGRHKSNRAVNIARPQVLIPVFPGTNCEYDTAAAFGKAGAKVEILVFKNRIAMDIAESLCEMEKTIKSSQIIVLPGGFSAGDEPDGSGKFIATVFRNPGIRNAVTEFIEHRDGLMLGICNGFQALVKLGLLPYGKIIDITEHSSTLTFNTLGRHVSRMVTTRVASAISPWYKNVNVGDLHTVAVSHGEGRFIAGPEDIKKMAEGGQIASQYVDLNGCPTYDILYNPNGSVEAIEAITSPDGRVLGKMAHSERVGINVAKNVPGNKNQRIFEAGVNYFR